MKYLQIAKVFVAIIFCSGLCACDITNAQNKTTVSLPANVLATLKTSHPRIMVNSLQAFQTIKAAESKYEFLLKADSYVIKHANAILKTPVLNYTNSAPNYLLTVSRGVLENVYNLAMAYRLTGDAKYADRLWTELSNAAKAFHDWNPSHFLDTSELLYAFAIGYDWLFDIWTPEQKSLLKQAIVNKGLLPGKAYYDGTVKSGYNWTKVDNNWNLVCNGGLIIAALAIADEEPALCKGIISNAVSRMPLAMKSFAPDGGWVEGPGYMMYALKYNVAAIAAMQSALGTDFNLSAMPGFSNTGVFLLATSGATGKTYNYGDGTTKLIEAPELLWLGKKFNKPELIEFKEKWTKIYDPTDLLWYANPDRVPGQVKLDNYFSGVEVASLKSSLEDTNAIFVAFKAGTNGVNHGHLDIGSFVLEKDAQRWFVDLGAENYGVKGYFAYSKTAKLDDNGGSTNRWNYYRTSTEGHNTLSIRTGSDYNQNAKAITKFIKFSDNENNAFGIMDITDAYSGNASSIQRGIRLLNKSQVIIQDEVNLNAQSDLYWIAQTPAAVNISDDGRSATLQLNGKQLMAKIVSPKGATFSTLSAAPILNKTVTASANSFKARVQSGNNDATNNGIIRLVVHLPDFTKGIIAIEFSGIKNPSPYVVAPLSQW